MKRDGENVSQDSAADIIAVMSVKLYLIAFY